MKEFLGCPLSQKADIELRTEKGPWNAGRSVGQKKPLTHKQVSEIRAHLLRINAIRDLALFNLAIDSMLRASDLLSLTLKDIRDEHGQFRRVGSTRQKKTNRAVRFSISLTTISSLKNWLSLNDQQNSHAYVFPGKDDKQHLSVRQYQRLVKQWVRTIPGSSPEDYSSHSMRRTKATLIYEATKNHEAIRILLGQASLSSTIHYLGVTETEALKIAARTNL